MAFAEFIVFVIATLAALVGIVVAWRGRKLARPRMVVAVGLESAAQVPRWITNRPVSSIVIGAGKSSDGRALLPCPVRVKNSSALPIEDLVVTLEYPSWFLIDNAVAYDWSEQTVSLPVMETGGTRTVTTLAGLSSVRYELGVLRPGEPGIVYDLLHVHRVDVNAHDQLRDSARLYSRVHRRFELVPEFVELVPIRVYVRAANHDQVVLDVVLVWFHADSVESLRTAFMNFAEAAWEEGGPLVGELRFDPLRVACGRRHHTQVLYLPDVSVKFESGTPSVVDQTIGCDGAASDVQVPPWGFIGESGSSRQGRATVRAWVYRFLRTRRPAGDDSDTSP